MKTLIFYATRTGLTREIAVTLGERLNAEVVRVTDGREYKGFFGYVAAAVAGLKKSTKPILPFSTALPLNEYDKIIVAAPIWCENVSSVARELLKEIKGKFNGDIYYIITHMSDLPYEAPIKRLDALAGKSASGSLSLQTKNHDWHSELYTFSVEYLIR